MNKAFINFATEFIRKSLHTQECNKKYQHLKKRVEGIVYYLQMVFATIGAIVLQLQIPHLIGDSPVPSSAG